MITDLENLLSNNQAITATARSTNVIDLQQTGIPYGNVERLRRDVGKGEPVPFLVQVTEAFNNLTSLVIAIETSDDPAFGSGNVTHVTFTVLLANLVAGYRLPYSTLVEALAGATTQGMKRYLSLNYTVTGTAPTTGKVFAGVVTGIQTNA